MNKAFLINNRFLIDPSLNILEDLEAQRKTRLEPRLMKLLCLLCEGEGKLISRDFLVNEIWDGYGGADEGLSQAISFLRKVLTDEKKELIKTVPKKGYILNAAVLKDAQKPVIKTSIQKNRYLLLLTAICAIGVFIVMIMLPRKEHSKDSDKKYKKEFKAKIKALAKGSKKSQ